MRLVGAVAAARVAESAPNAPPPVVASTHAASELLLKLFAAKGGDERGKESGGTVRGPSGRHVW